MIITHKVREKSLTFLYFLNGIIAIKTIAIMEMIMMNELDLSNKTLTDNDIKNRIAWFVDNSKLVMQDDKQKNPKMLDLIKEIVGVGKKDIHELNLSRNSKVVKDSAALTEYKQYLSRALLHEAVGRITYDKLKHIAYDFISYAPVN